MTGGIYVHFPYCEHRCTYCDFVIATPRVIPQKRFTDAVLSELRFRAEALDGPAHTLYLGGGTPSLWDPKELKRLINAVKSTPGLVEGAEVTLEANPNEVTDARLVLLRELGVNRISLGVQSFQNDLLTTIERTHDGQTAEHACNAIKEAGFPSHSIDLIFGLPGQDLSRWREDLEKAITLRPPHLSVYGLTVEANTVLEHHVSKGLITLPDEGLQTEMMLSARKALRAEGYIHYEVSSYALEGHRAKHNSAYWRGTPYLGLGPGAHAFLPPIRSVNIARTSVYIQAALDGDPTESIEELDTATMSFERIMTGLRDLELGVDVSPDWRRYEDALKRQVALGNLTLSGRRATLT